MAVVVVIFSRYPRSHRAERPVAPAGRVDEGDRDPELMVGEMLPTRSTVEAGRVSELGQEFQAAKG
jgi:hypothetical protein